MQAHPNALTETRVYSRFPFQRNLALARGPRTYTPMTEEEIDERETDVFDALPSTAVEEALECFHMSPAPVIRFVPRGEPTETCVSCHQMCFRAEADEHDGSCFDCWCLDGGGRSREIPSTLTAVSLWAGWFLLWIAVGFLLVD